MNGFSDLNPVVQGYGNATWIPPLVGFLLGAACLRGVDMVLPHMHPGLKTVEGVKTSWQRSPLLVLAITIHDFPESQTGGNVHLATAGVILGFAVMMTLDVALG